jgi:hypothetical protein
MTASGCTKPRSDNRFILRVTSGSTRPPALDRFRAKDAIAGIGRVHIEADALELREEAFTKAGTSELVFAGTRCATIYGVQQIAPSST